MRTNIPTHIRAIIERTCKTTPLFFLLFGVSVGAHILPIKTFTISDGLAHNTIHQIFQDPKGYLWIATAEGLSRFDGYTFKNYGRADGLGGSYINDVTADREDRLWVAINDGCAKPMDQILVEVVH